MTSRDFCYWLQGYFELMNETRPVSPLALSAHQTTVIQNHLAMVFKHEIDPSFGGPEEQKKLDHLHGHTGGPDSGTLYRC